MTTRITIMYGSNFVYNINIVRVPLTSTVKVCSIESAKSERVDLLDFSLAIKFPRAEVAYENCRNIART